MGAPSKKLQVSHYPNKTMCNVQPPKTKQLITNTLTPKTMGNHGSPLKKTASFPLPK